MLVVGVVIGSADALAQGRGNAYGHDKHHKKGNDHHDKWDRDHNVYNRYDDHHRKDYHHNHHYKSREWHGHTSNHYGYSRAYHRPPHWVHHHHNYRSTARYIYYRDYDVYFDCYRGVYISLSGRNWVYSQHLPVCMHYANFSRIAYVELDYFEDDLPRYIERRRTGGYVSIHARF